MKQLMALFSLIFLLSFFSCSNPSGSGGLPVETKQWVTLSDGWTQFYTNDTDNYNYWFWIWIANPNSDPNVYEINAKKISGAAHIGYGMVFCGETGVNSYYRIYT
ncbi:hypothetical protein LJC14_06435 [Treponema sp. OttesenSCG-928-L16]|nr:hypothetical protein [Treponema sp. OttesenSCG-928-L16]